METRKLFYEDSHLKQFEGTVLSCEQTKNGYEVVLDQTAFFPEGGGQYADGGILLVSGKEYKVSDVKERDGLIYHITAAPVEVGAKASGILDYEERFYKMQQHTGEHIVSGLIHQKFGYDNVGFHLGSDLVSMDFNGVLTKEDLEKIEREANKAVCENLEIEVTYPSKEELRTLSYRSKIEIEGQVRIVTVPGYDVCACCAPHVKRTGEIGIIRLLGGQKYKGGTRVLLACGFRAIADYRMKEKQVGEISVLLSAKVEETANAVQRLKSETEHLKNEAVLLQNELTAYKVKELPKDQKITVVFEGPMAAPAIRHMVNLMMEQCGGIAAVFSGKEQDGYSYLVGSKREDVRELVKELNEKCRGRGGGKPQMCQGFVQAEKSAIQSALCEKIVKSTV